MMLQKKLFIPLGIDLQLIKLPLAEQRFIAHKNSMTLSFFIPVWFEIFYQKDSSAVVVQWPMNRSAQGPLYYGLVRAAIYQLTNTTSISLFSNGTGFKFNILVDLPYVSAALGFTHQKLFRLPFSVRAVIEDDKSTRLRMECSNSSVLGQARYDIQKLRKPDAYKGKGILRVGYTPKLKEGKKQK
jgi:large subunit ribosomal protein L6